MPAWKQAQPQQNPPISQNASTPRAGSPGLLDDMNPKLARAQNTVINYLKDKNILPPRGTPSTKEHREIIASIKRAIDEQELETIKTNIMKEAARPIPQVAAKPKKPGQQPVEFPVPGESETYAPDASGISKGGGRRRKSKSSKSKSRKHKY